MRRAVVVVAVLAATAAAAPTGGAAASGALSATGLKLSQEVFAKDAVSGDSFGGAVAIDGDTMVVGANAHKGGAAYVFVRSSGRWRQVQELFPDAGSANDGFGQAVAISGARIVVSAFAQTVNGNGAQGVVYVFTRAPNGRWHKTAELTARDGASGDYLGEAVKIYGSVVVAGAGNHNDFDGAVYIFTRSDAPGAPNGGWSQLQELRGPSGQQYAYGTSLALASATLVVGVSPQVGGKFSYNRPGFVDIFKPTRGGWTRVARFRSRYIDGFGGQSGYGYVPSSNSIATTNTTLAVGAGGHGTASRYAQGLVYVFTRSASGHWSQTAALRPSAAGQNEQFGNAVSLSGGMLAVGAPGQDSPYGVIYQYRELSPASWKLIGQASSHDQNGASDLGVALASSPTEIVAGAPGQNHGLLTYTGAVFVFTPAS